MQTSACFPQPFDAMADARSVYAILKTEALAPGTLHDAEVRATMQLWPCKGT
jgi:hypothetical protein